ncbi:FliM/FliN family flagellar motor switch protein [Shigella sonnei]|nr:FliM/FliN family flagellar motor switch protein [Shigella sonnei]
MGDSILSQAEIDALLNGDSEVKDEPTASVSGESDIRPYDPNTQRRVVRERLQALEIINERFARHFRMGLFNLLRRSPDITVGAIRIQPYHEFARNLPVPTNLNLIHLKPLRGTGLVVFSPSLVFIAVDNLFGGDGRFPTKVEGREFTHTEQRVINRMLKLALDGLAGEPLDILINGYLIAQGEVVVVADKYGVRITDIITPSERMRRLSR